MPLFTLPSLGTPKLRLRIFNSLLVAVLLGTFAWLPAQNVGVGTATPGASLDVNGNLALRELTQAMATGANANVALPAASTVRITGPAGAFSLSGLVAPAAANGQVVVLVNGTAFALTLQHNNAGSVAANRLALPGNADAIVAAGGTVILSYSPTATRWQAVAITGSCGGSVAFSQTLRQDFAANGNTNTSPSATSLDLMASSFLAAPSCAGGTDYAGANFTPANGAVLSGTHCNINVFTVSAGTTVNVAPWNGATGGSLTIIANSIVIDGILTADGRGYGGGAGGMNDYNNGAACPAGRATGGAGGNGGNGAYGVWFNCNLYGGGGGGGSPNGTGGPGSGAPSTPGNNGTAAGGGNGGQSVCAGGYIGGVGGPGYGGGGGGGGGCAAAGGAAGGGGTGGAISNGNTGGNGAGPAAGTGGAAAAVNVPGNGVNGGYNVANGNTDATTTLAVNPGSGGGGAGSSFDGSWGGGGGGGGAGGGSILLYGATSVNVGAAGQVLTRGGGGGQSGGANFLGYYGGGGGGGGVALAGGTVTVAGTVDARGYQAQTLATANGGTVKYFASTLSVTGAVLAGRTYTGSLTVPSYYLTPGTSASQVILRSPNCAWGVLTFNTTLPSGATTLTVDVLDAAGNVLAAGVASGTNLSTLAAVTGQTSIRLRANLATGNTAQTPSLLDWRIDY